jgi:hypothetical protein
MRKGLLLLALPLALAACGDHSYQVAPKPDPAAYVRHSASRTAGTPSEHMTESDTISAVGQKAVITAVGDYSNSPSRGSFTASFSFPGHTLKFNEILDGTMLYLRSPQLSRKLPAGKKWFSIDFAKVAKSHGIDYSSLMSQTPTKALQQLEAAGTVTQVGTETIRGVATTHFHVANLDVSKLPQGAKLEALAHPTYGPIDVWIGNSNGYVYRQTMSFSFSIKGVSGSITISADFSKFGEAVHVTVPPASQTVDETNKALQGAGG